MKVAFYTLGCKVNQYDTQMMSEKFENAGHQVVSFEDDADIFVINTCTVTQMSDKKSRQVISKAKRKNPDAIIAVCGCFSQVSPDDAAAISGVDIVIGTRNRPDILYYVNLFLKTGAQVVDVEKVSDIKDERISDFSEKTRAILKIEDGCRNFCSYCLIPFARGKIVSKPIENIIADATAVAKSGYKEIVLTGIHLSSYGKDIGGIDLADAIKAVAEIEGVERIRLGSLEPTLITESFIEKVKDCKKLCPSFHLSLQSGCDNTLAAMNRKYTSSQYEQAISLIRQNFEEAAFTTDIIVGFPGETDEDFEKSLEFAKRIGFAKIHIFPYSKRKGTKAASMDGQLTKAIKQAREKQLMQIEYQSRLEFMKNTVGKKVSVLVEQCTDGICNGFTKNYIQVRFEGSPDLCNSIVDVTVLNADENFLYAQLIY